MSAKSKETFIDSEVFNQVLAGMEKRTERYIYNETNDRRFSYSRGEKSLQVSLQAKTYAGTWAELMNVGFNDNPGQDPSFFLSMVVLDEEQGFRSGAPNWNVYYSTNDPKWTVGHGGGFYGEFPKIEAQLRSMSPNGVYLRELPKHIDVGATILSFFDHLSKDDFTQPSFVLKLALFQNIKTIFSSRS